MNTEETSTTESTSTLSEFSMSKSSDVIHTTAELYKGKLTVSDVRRVGLFFESRADFIHITFVSKKFQDFVDGYRFNPISETKLFPSIEEQHLYTPKDLPSPRYKQYVYRYSVDYSFFLAHNCENCDFRTVTFTQTSPKPTQIGYGVTHILFKGMFSNTLESIALPKSLISIGESAFENCDWLTAVTLGGISEMKRRCFANCRRLKELNVPNTVKLIGDHSFANCSLMTSLTLPSKLKFIGKGCFNNCVGLVKVHTQCRIYRGLVSYHVAKLISMNITKCAEIEFTASDREVHGNVIPQNIKILGEECFAGCMFDTLKIPKSVIEIDTKAFSKCTRLEGVVLSDSIKIIEDGAFMCDYSLKEVVLPNFIEEISENCFLWCRSLVSITIPENVRFIRKSAFENCKALSAINFPNTLEVIGDHAFAFCDELKEILLPKGVTSLEGECFINCSSLSKVVLPCGLIHFGENVVSGCDSLREIETNPHQSTFSAKVPFRIAQLLLKNNVKCLDIVFTKEDRLVFPVGVPLGVQEIGHGCFFGADITSIQIPTSVTLIDDFCFFNCRKLRSCTVKDTVTFGKNCFGDCGMLNPKPDTEA
ncbi:hypothetical protein EIN_380070 [Entamoeba invadens IP1]|uniref:Leucine rich repeat containing protein BspA family protein n=1 Tax=Entamoeba invadens IP1 TaxID=370355 RepID=A0A0A1UAU6_ENTIV|nr:hypothetical protein EIN_380070 [Entamoeba invadens IP1]ELP92110.1 hypothetical protein EIN_380070 [Entamoeba invadens IP1]|eukprot:XP_004258881.1 hypothetical protein EIN_380070 [Entamoeba invadens IP1]